MSNAISISVDQRDLTGSSNARRMRKTGAVPAIVYSRASQTIHLAVKSEFVRKLQSHVGIVELVCPSGEKKNVILKDLQIHPISLLPLHLDFLEVKADEIITVTVPLECVGEPVGLRQGGQLELVMHELEIQCLPAQVPQVISIDVSELNQHHAFYIKNLVLAEGLTAVADPELIICQVRAPRTTVEETETEETEEETAETAEAESDNDKE